MVNELSVCACVSVSMSMLVYTSNVAHRAYSYCSCVSVAILVQGLDRTRCARRCPLTCRQPRGARLGWFEPGDGHKVIACSQPLDNSGASAEICVFFQVPAGWLRQALGAITAHVYPLPSWFKVWTARGVPGVAHSPAVNRGAQGWGGSNQVMGTRL